jgi:hypothetical protein
MQKYCTVLIMKKIRQARQADEGYALRDAMLGMPIQGRHRHP